MHPFGGTPICPRCAKSVYAAEQIMGPGRKLYHKPCLACTSCAKRLDSYTLLEHDQQPYCKQCHIKHFGTRDLRNANLPDRDDVLGHGLSPPTAVSALPSVPPSDPGSGPTATGVGVGGANAASTLPPRGHSYSNSNAGNIPNLPPHPTPSSGVETITGAIAGMGIGSGAPALPARRPPANGAFSNGSNGYGAASPSTNGSGRPTSPRLLPTRTLSPPLLAAASSNSHSPNRSISGSPAPPNPPNPHSHQHGNKEPRERGEDGRVTAPSWGDPSNSHDRDAHKVSSSTPITPPRPTASGESARETTGGTGGIPRTIPLSTLIPPSPTKASHSSQSAAAASSTEPETGPESPPQTQTKTLQFRFGAAASSSPAISAAAATGAGGYVRSAGLASHATGAGAAPLAGVGVTSIPTGTGTPGNFALGHTRGGGGGGGAGSKGSKGSFGAGGLGGMGGTPTCARCGKVVYFAEQVKALNKTYHKSCMRCSGCNTSLDSTKLTEKDGEPFCRRCYAKLFGPQGSGYALLGKPGG